MHIALMLNVGTFENFNAYFKYPCQRVQREMEAH